MVLPVWAPWLDSQGTENLSKRVFDAFGPLPSSCFDGEGVLLQKGVEVRWYPMGRMVHTCSGDYVVWMWGAVKELGGVYKRAEELQPIQRKALTCSEVLERQEARKATSTDNTIKVYDGPYAIDPDFSIFKEAEGNKNVILESLKQGPDFAGKFAIAKWGCGSSCLMFAVTDVESGLVVAYGPQTEFGIEYSLDSTLLVTNPISKLPQLPESVHETESLALSTARVSREYYRMTTDVLSQTQYLVRQCVESATTGYIEVEDDRLGVVNEKKN